MKKPDEKIIPLRIEPDLAKAIDDAALLTSLFKQDIMRLCMRIGLVDLRAAEHDLPGIVKRIADDKGVSFQAYAKAQTAQPEGPLPPRREVRYESTGRRVAKLDTSLNEPHKEP
jgi:hypothetical protein